MESSRTSMNGKTFRSQLHPSSRILTRSKKQVYLHCNRSGRYRSDFASNKNLIPKLPPPFVSSRKKPKTELSNEDEKLLHTPIKDRRTKRVFSPALIDGCSLKPSDDSRTEKLEVDLGRGDPYVNSSSLLRKECCGNEENVKNNEEIEKVDEIAKIISSIVSEYSPDGDNEGTEDSENTEETQNLHDQKSKLSVTNGFVRLSNGDGSNEESVQTTPPDAEIVPNVNRSEGHTLESVMQPSEGNPKSSCANNCNRNESISKTRLALRPCFKRKLFKTPGSFGYKRLLPYLMNVSGDNSCSQEDGQCPKLEANMEKRPIQTSVGYQSQGISRDTSNEYCPSNAIKLNLAPPDNTSRSLMPSNSLCLINKRQPEALVNGSANFETETPWKDLKSCGLNHYLSLVMEDSGVGEDNKFSTFSNAKNLMENGEAMEPNFHISKIVGNVRNISSDVDKCHLGNHEVGNRFVDAEPYESVGMKKAESKLCKTEKNGADSIKVLTGKDDSNEESFQITQPDASISDKPTVEESGGQKVECSLLANRGLEKPSSCRENNSYDSNIGEMREGSNHRRKRGHSPCSRLKIFQSPGSFSYRRLLPFLTDHEKENSLNSCVSANGECAELQIGLASMVNSRVLKSSCQVISLDKLNSSKSHLEQHTVDSGIRQLTAVNPTNDLASEKEPNLTSLPCIMKLPKPSQSQIQHSQAEQVVVDRHASETCNKVGLAHGDVVHTLLDPIPIPESLLGEGARSGPTQSHANTEKVCLRLGEQFSNDSKLTEENSSQLKSSLAELVVPSETMICPIRGILKRNPRGCRGVCPCINCSSFRLHAERAFEFSRNQLLDAEEVALDLMKDLSYLRNVLEKTSDSTTDDVAVRLNQVKEACMKASEGELFAKGRLRQLKYELDIHCRITCSQRPNVKFANNIEEKVIQDLPSQNSIGP